MQAIIRTKAGKAFSTMRVENLPAPAPQPDELKVKMASSRVNPVDMDLMKGFPTLKYKQPQIGGIDGAGTVLEVGKNVQNFKAGDQVLFYRLFSDIGTWAEEITVKAADCAKIPTTIDLKEAGAIALPLLTAYDGLMQLGAKSGEKILIHGVGGGVGFQALQIAKKTGLYVVGTASQNDATVLKKAGLDQLIDYKTQDFSTVLPKGGVDYVFDVMGGDILKKSIDLQPKKVVSVKYVDTAQMHKAGVRLPSPMQWLMKLMMGTFVRRAKRHNVQLIGQVTGANGAMLQQAVDMVQNGFISRAYPTRTLADIAAKGLNKSDVGKVIEF